MSRFGPALAHVSSRTLFWSMALLMAAGTFVPAQRAHAQSENRFAGAGVSEGLEEMPWITPGNITADDGAEATISNYDSDEFEKTLRSHTYGFTIPGGATIDGIEVIVGRRNSSAPGLADDIIRLAKAGTAIGDNKSTGVTWPTSEASITYGSPTDLWGTTWTPAEINAGGFGATLNPLNTGNAENAAVDYHRIIVYYTTAETILLVVPDAASLTAQDAAKKTLIESWGYTVALISANDTQGNFDAAVATSDAVYVSEEISSADLNTKLTSATIGLVLEEGALADEFGFSTGELNYTDSAIDITDNTHYITSAFSTGSLTIASPAQPLHYLDGTIAAGAHVLAEQLATANRTLVVLDVGAALEPAGTAAGRRVFLPWGPGAFDINSLTVDGQTLMQRAIEWATGLGTDSTPPDAVADLATGTVTTSSVDLSWTAPGDDGATGTATTYDVRYSTSTITAGNWGSATQATGEPSPQVAGSGESFTVTGLSASTTYYFAIKTSDEVPNESTISNVPSGTTTGPASLVARYWMEEASSGQAPTQLLDDQASPLNLPITYDGANYSYTALPTGRGWTSTTTNNQGRATTLVDGTKIQTTLDGATAATIEVVLAIDALNTSASRIFHIGDASDSGYLTLSSPNATTLYFYSLGGTLRGQWNPGFDGTRAVYHLVYDSSEPTAGDRVRLCKNGVLQTSTGGTAPPLNETLSIPNGKYFAIANRELCCRSFDGAIYYAALYDGALTASEVSTKQAALLVTDDSGDLTPPDAVADLATGNVRSTSVQLSWTAPGDDGATGTATSYDIRYSTSTITEGNWAAATQATGEPAPQIAGSSETFTVTGLSGSTTYYFAIKTSDEVPNESAISNVPSATTDLDGMTQTGFAWSDDVASFTSKGDDVTLDAVEGTTYVIAIQVAMTQGAASNPWVLQVREDGAGSWLDVAALGGGESPVWETDNTHTFSKSNGNVVSVAEFGNGTAPTYFTAVDGEFSDDNNGVTDGYTGPDVYTELQYTIRASGASNGHTYEFRVLYNGAVLDAYNTYATVADPGAPNAVADLATGTLTSSSVQLNWTAPGDNGATGTATSYDVRYSTSVINDGNWASATQATGEPAPQVGGSAETFTVTGLNSSTLYYFAIKTSDEVPNESALSNVPSATTLNGAPTVAAAIADTTVAQDNPPVDNYRDLKVVFTDFEDGSALTYTIQANTNAALVTPTIGADSALDLSFTAGLNGAATITVRATDSGTLFVDDVFTVTVLDGIAPDAITNLATGTVTASSVQLTWTAPGDDAATGTATTYDVRYSTAVINDGNWASATQATGEPAPQVAGSSETFTVTGLNSSTLYYFAIKASDEVPNESALSNVPSATTLNGAPTVAAAIADTTVAQDNPPVDNYRDLKVVFTDFEDGSALTYTIQANTNAALVTPTIGADSALDLSFTAGLNGAATITVRATDSGTLFVDDVFTVTVLDTQPPGHPDHRRRQRPRSEFHGWSQWRRNHHGPRHR